MHQGNVSEMAAKFTAAYLALKEKKDVDKLLTIIKPMIMSAKADGITDKELLEIINDLGLREKFYPAKLKELRKKLLKADEDVPVGDTDEGCVDEDAPPGVLSAAFSTYKGSGRAHE